MTAETILALARKELGEREFPPNSNRVKYNTAYYGREVSGSAYSWCCVFLWWLFQQGGAGKLFYGGKKTAYCPTLLSYHRSQWVTDYQPGDIIFFNFTGKSSAAHVGLCESWDGAYITTIDGNTGTGNEANGGSVMRRRRHKQYIVGAYRPAYQTKQEEPELTEAQVRAIIQDEWAKQEAGRAAQSASLWAQPYIAAAVEAGVMAQSPSGEIDRPRAYVTREELATVAAQILEKLP